MFCIMGSGLMAESVSVMRVVALGFGSVMEMLVDGIGLGRCWKAAVLAWSLLMNVLNAYDGKRIAWGYMCVCLVRCAKGLLL